MSTVRAQSHQQLHHFGLKLVHEVICSQRWRKLSHFHFFTFSNLVTFGNSNSHCWPKLSWQCWHLRKEKELESPKYSNHIKLPYQIWCNSSFLYDKQCQLSFLIESILTWTKLAKTTSQPTSNSLSLPAQPISKTMKVTLLHPGENKEGIFLYSGDSFTALKAAGYLLHLQSPIGVMLCTVKP